MTQPLGSRKEAPEIFSRPDSISSHGTLVFGLASKRIFRGGWVGEARGRFVFVEQGQDFALDGGKKEQHAGHARNEQLVAVAASARIDIAQKPHGAPSVHGMNH